MSGQIKGTKLLCTKRILGVTYDIQLGNRCL